MKKAVAGVMWGLRKGRRLLYNSRKFVPGLARQHRLEVMIGPLGVWKDLEAYQFRVLQEHGLKPEHRLLDIGCGPLQGGVAFIRYLQPNSYVGIDTSQRSLDAAFGQIEHHRLAAKNPRLLCSTSFGDAELGPDQFDYFWASQILYYFDEALMTRLFQFLAKRMRPRGMFLGDIIGASHPDFHRPSQSDQLWDLILHRVETLRQWAAPHGLRVHDQGEIRRFGYPKRLRLGSNTLLKITRSADAQAT